MNVRMSSTALAAALVLGLAAGPASPALAAAGTGAPAAPGHGAQREATGQAPDAEALRAAIQWLPKDDATAALVRVSGSGGDWRGTSGVHDLASGRPADPDGRFRAAR